MNVQDRYMALQQGHYSVYIQRLGELGCAMGSSSGGYWNWVSDVEEKKSLVYSYIQYVIS